MVVATGVAYRRLDVPGLEELPGAGVFYGAAVSRGQGRAGQHVFVVGGGNSAGQAAVHLAGYAEQVTMVVRGTSLADGMSDYLVEEMQATAERDVRLRTEVIAAGGEGAWRRSPARPGTEATETRRRGGAVHPDRRRAPDRLAGRRGRSATSGGSC